MSASASVASATPSKERISTLPKLSKRKEDVVSNSTQENVSMSMKTVTADDGAASSSSPKNKGKKGIKTEKPKRSPESLFADCLEILIKRLKDNGVVVNKDAIIPVIKYAMEIVEDEVEDGSEKHRIVLLMVRKLIEQSSLDLEGKQLLDHLLASNFVSDTIGMVIDATKGQLNINLPKPDSRCCFFRYFCCCCCCFPWCRNTNASSNSHSNSHSNSNSNSHSHSHSNKDASSAPVSASKMGDSSTPTPIPTFPSVPTNAPSAPSGSSVTNLPPIEPNQA